MLIKDLSKVIKGLPDLDFELFVENTQNPFGNISEIYQVHVSSYSTFGVLHPCIILQSSASQSLIVENIGEDTEKIEKIIVTNDFFIYVEQKLVKIVQELENVSDKDTLEAYVKAKEFRNPMTKVEQILMESYSGLSKHPLYDFYITQQIKKD